MTIFATPYCISLIITLPKLVLVPPEPMNSRSGGLPPVTMLLFSLLSLTIQRALSTQHIQTDGFSEKTEGMSLPFI